MTTANTTATSLNATQIRVARRLAAAYGHRWAMNPATAGLITVAAIAAAAEPYETWEWGGIDTPSATHVTGSGRTKWEILPSGEVRGEIRVLLTPYDYSVSMEAQQWVTVLRVEGGAIRWVRPDLVDLRQLEGADRLARAIRAEPRTTRWGWFGPAAGTCPSHKDLIRLRKQADWAQAQGLLPEQVERGDAFDLFRQQREELAAFC